MSIVPLTLSLLPEILAICRLEPGAPLPQWLPTNTFFSITGTEMSFLSSVLWKLYPIM
jgi:hypothetical protein